METIIYRHVQPSAVEAQQLIEELSGVLHGMTGDTGKSSFAEDRFNPDRDVFVVAFLEDTPVGCGAFRAHGDRTCEIKRMYARVRGVGTGILQHLEDTASVFGYVQAVLSTRRVNTRAVAFYQRHGYQEIAPYGKYRLSPVSICLGKTLDHAPAAESFPSRIRSRGFVPGFGNMPPLGHRP
jgi:GNAT superfamily N-acetyltransferase